MMADPTQERTPGYRGASYAGPVGEAKRPVTGIDQAGRLMGSGGLRRAGKEWAVRRLLPDHEDRTPSFPVNEAKSLWWCHGCFRGGDVVELARLAWGYDRRDAHLTAAMLLSEFRHEVPQRPPASFRKRAAPGAGPPRRYRRRIYRWLFAPVVARIEDEAERLEEARASWEDVGRMAAMVVAYGCREVSV